MKRTKGNYSTADGQRRLMAESMGLPSDTYTQRRVNTSRPGDCGTDPAENGMVRMVPSGDIVTVAEAQKRLAAARRA